MAQELSQLNPGPEWLAHRYDPIHDAVHFLVADRDLRRSSPFLTDEHLPAGNEPLIVRRSELRIERKRVHFIFHSAYCCSTLLASALDIAGHAMALKEPVLLNDIVGWRQRRAAPDAVSQVLDDGLSLLARPFLPDEATIIKPSNVVNGLATAMMTLRPQAKAILLYAPLEAYLASIARKGMTGRLWVRELLSRQMVDGLIDLGFSPKDYLLQTDLQVAAIGWLAQFKLFADMATRWPDRVRTLDSEVLTQNPKYALQIASSFFDMSPSDEALTAIVDTVFARNSKDGSYFAAGQRDSDRNKGMTIHAAEIEQVRDWAWAVARHAGVPITLAEPLIS